MTEQQLDFRFKDLLVRQRDKEKQESILAIALLGFVVMVLLYFTITSPFTLIFGSITLVFGLIGYGIVMNRKDVFLEDGRYWYKLITETPERILWIQPVVTKHTVGFVLTLYKERSFIIYTDGKSRLNIKCENSEEQTIFFYGLAKFLSEVQYGHTSKISILYNDDKATFLEKIKERGWYTPVSSFLEESNSDQ
ncbi:MAG: hypothetical protein JJ975_03575 [Bacteroidia bacterium]|nr:hypothetical protein [Bacteroidia bacterium]